MTSNARGTYKGSRGWENTVTVSTKKFLDNWDLMTLAEEKGWESPTKDMKPSRHTYREEVLSAKKFLEREGYDITLEKGLGWRVSQFRF